MQQPFIDKEASALKLLFLIALLIAVALLQDLPVRAQQPTAIPVGVLPAELRPVTQASDFVGRIEAIERVDVRARITGFLQDILFKEGDVVKEGDVLYRIEPETFQAAVLQAQGAVLEAQARLANASAQRARTQELARTDVESRATLDQRIAQEKSAQAETVKADANLKTANVNLGYTEIVAPITGEIGRSKLTKGNVVSPDSGVLTTIVSQNPMYVVFPVSQRELLRIRQDAPPEERRSKRDELAIRIQFSNGSVYPEAGRINFVDVTVDRATDTITVRGTVPNPNGALVDGELVRVSVETDRPQEKVLVPQAALLVDQQGPYVFAVVDGKAVIKRVKLGGESGPFAVVDSGVQAGDQIITQGMESLRPGVPVTATPAQRPLTGG